MNLGEANRSIFCESSQVVIYGAGVYGEYVYTALAKLGIKPICFCDRAKAGRYYKEIPIYSYEKIYELESPIVLLAVGAQYNEVADFLDKKKIAYYDIYKLCFEETVFEEEQLSEQTRDINYYKALYRFGKNYRMDANELRMFSVDWVITEKCSLKCRDCSNLMQYYQKPQNKDVDNLVMQLESLMDVCEELMDVRIIGGEPFMHPEIANILERGLKIKGINNISIYTNATILPSDRMIELMKNPKVKCEISDYGPLAKNYNEFIKTMEKEGIRHHIVKLTEWHKLGRLENHHRSEQALREVFKNCYCNDLITLLDGKLYRCPYSAHGRNLGAIPFREEDVVNVFEKDRELLKTQIQKLVFEKDQDLACGFCDGRNYHLATVEPAIQTDKPLPYEKIN